MPFFSRSSYRFSHPQHGRCIIINNKNFTAEPEPGFLLTERYGTDADAKELSELFEGFHFKVSTHNDRSVSNIHQIIDEVAKEDHKDQDCIVMCVLSYGDKEGIYGTDGKLSIDDILRPFRGDNCQDLVGKPKIFIIQACPPIKIKLVSMNQSNLLQSPCAEDQLDIPLIQKKTPIQADFLIYLSRVPGNYSWSCENQQQLSWFVSTFSEAMKNADHTEEDLAALLVKVNNKICMRYESASNKAGLDDVGVPCITSRLTKKIYLGKK